jgi:hypothetical protein
MSVSTGMSQLPYDVSALLSDLNRFIAKGGPQRTDYAAVDQWLASADRLAREGHIERSALRDAWKPLGPEFLSITGRSHSFSNSPRWRGVERDRASVFAESTETNLFLAVE